MVFRFRFLNSAGAPPPPPPPPISSPTPGLTTSPYPAPLAGRVAWLVALAFTAEASTFFLAARWLVSHLPGGAAARPSAFTALSWATLVTWLTSRGPLLAWAMWQLVAEVHGGGWWGDAPLVALASLGAVIIAMSAMFSAVMLRRGVAAFVTPRREVKDA